MTREDGSVTGGGVYRSGPTAKEEKVIRQMVAQGATVKDLRARFRDIEPKALELWHSSLKKGAAAASEPEDDEPGAGEPQGEPAAEPTEPTEKKGAKGRKGKAKPE
jgi:hypothetical protein